MKYIKESHRSINTQRLKELIDPIDFYSHEGHDVELIKKSEWKSGGFCPFHNDRKAGSFFISSLNGAFKCFSCGASGGDVIAYTQKKYELTFLEAYQRLSKKWGAYE